MSYDVIIIGGGPAGLSAALALGRARNRVLLCDAGSPRNSAAIHVQNFVTRDGIPPREFRRVGREQLAPYATVEVRDVRVEAIAGERGRFEVELASGRVEARRILLCTGMIDELPELEGVRAFWGKSIFICPYCHAWEVRDRRFAAWVTSVEMFEFPMMLRAWTNDVLALTNGALAIPDELRARVLSAGVRLDERKIARLSGRGEQLEEVVFESGPSARVDALFMKPPQRQVPIVQSLGLTLDRMGYVQINEHHETSRPGVYAGGDLVMPMQGAILAAASGTRAAAMINHALTIELAVAGQLSR